MACLFLIETVREVSYKRFRFLSPPHLNFCDFQVMQRENRSIRMRFHMQHWMVNCLTEKLCLINPLLRASRYIHQKIKASCMYSEETKAVWTRRYLKASGIVPSRSVKNPHPDRPGTTEFSNDLGRNLTNDEWSIRELRRLTVKREDIERFFSKSGFWNVERKPSAN